MARATEAEQGKGKKIQHIEAEKEKPIFEVFNSITQQPKHKLSNSTIIRSVQLNNQKIEQLELSSTWRRADGRWRRRRFGTREGVVEGCGEGRLPTGDW